MKILLLFIALVLQFRIVLAAENPVAESILEGLGEDVLVGLKYVILEGEYIMEGGLIPLSIAEEMYANIEISSSDRKIFVSRNKKRRMIRDSEPEDLLKKIGFE